MYLIVLRVNKDQLEYSRTKSKCNVKDNPSISKGCCDEHCQVATSPIVHPPSLSSCDHSNCLLLPSNRHRVTCSEFPSTLQRASSDRKVYVVTATAPMLEYGEHELERQREIVCLARWEMGKLALV